MGLSRDLCVRGKSIFISDLVDGVGSVYIKFVDVMDTEGVVSMLEDKIGIQNDLGKLRKWLERERRSIGRYKCKLLRLNRNWQLHSYWWSGNFTEVKFEC